MYRILMCAAAALFIGNQAAAQAPNHEKVDTPRVVIDDIMVPSSDPGIKIYVRNKHPEDMHTSHRSGLFCSFTALRTRLKPRSIYLSAAHPGWTR
jgi:hypothetical protein